MLIKNVCLTDIRLKMVSKANETVDERLKNENDIKHKSITCHEINFHQNHRIMT